MPRVLRQFLETEAAGRDRPAGGRGGGAGVGQLAVERLLRDAVAHRPVRRAGPVRARRGPPALGERRAHGPVLLRRRPRDQARARPRRPAGAAGGGHAGHRRPRRHGRARPAVPPGHRRRRRSQGLGHPHGHRHRLRHRRRGPARVEGAGIAQAVPADLRHRRRHRRHRGDRRLLRHRRAARVPRRRSRPRRS